MSDESIGDIYEGASDDIERMSRLATEYDEDWFDEHREAIFEIGQFAADMREQSKEHDGDEEAVESFDRMVSVCNDLVGVLEIYGQVMNARKDNEP